jgi:2-keto-4-pentenoate hydratase/2-oxohepta-3-ene-1,7-dioic acid hydratase in catechol pathway
MKLVTFDDGKVGRIEGDRVIQLDVPDMRTYYERGQEAGETGESFALADVRLRAPIVPKKFFHTAGNFQEHHEESKNVNWSHPVLPWIVFFQNVDAIIGTDDNIVYPPNGLTNEVDYELELAVVIGKAGKFFSPEEAGEYIAGYLIFNDITARDIQREEMKSGVFSLSKGIDTFCPIGPWIVTPDEVGDPHALDISLTLNGETMQSSNTSRFIFDIPTLIGTISEFIPLNPGDVVLTGTPEGVGFRRDPKVLLRDGDSMAVEVENVGRLESPVRAER